MGKAAEGLENELRRRCSDESLENEAEPHFPTLTSLHLRYM